MIMDIEKSPIRTRLGCRDAVFRQIVALVCHVKIMCASKILILLKK